MDCQLVCIDLLVLQVEYLLNTNSSKDAVIRVWDRKTLELYRVLRGHEGPVNAVGLQNGRVVWRPTIFHLFFLRILSRSAPVVMENLFCGILRAENV
jgi:WD40 repeat protein